MAQTQIPGPGRPVLIAAAIVGASVLAGSSMLVLALERIGTQLSDTSAKLSSIQVAVADAQSALANLRVPLAPTRGPDPNRRHTVNIAGAPALGPEQAPVTIVEFSDYQCPFCGRVEATLKQVREKYPDRVRIVFKHLPLDIHSKALAAHAAAEAAARQGKFWEMHDKIFANQAAMSPEKYAEWARELGLDMARFERDRASAEVKARIAADKREAAQLGATGTPSFFINGKYSSGAKPFEAFQALIDAELAVKKGG
jgi:protein-disulfide isomerase